MCQNVNFGYGITDCANAPCGTAVASTIISFGSLLIGNYCCLDRPEYKTFVFRFYVVIYITKCVLDKGQKTVFGWLTKQKLLHHEISCILYRSIFLFYFQFLILCFLLVETFSRFYSFIPFLFSASLLWRYIHCSRDSIIRIY